MKINVFLVEKIFHYAPIYCAFETLSQVSKNSYLKIEYFETERDFETIKRLIEEEDDPNSISIYLTSLPEIRERLRRDFGQNGDVLEKIYENCILWMMMIDRAPISIVSIADKTQQDFDEYWEKYSVENTKQRLKLACYPEGSTVDWFINRSFNRLGAFDIIRVPFGKGAEFDAISNGTCDFAITLEPWLLPHNQQIIHDIPIAPFGFTGILSHKRHFNHPGKRVILYEIVKATYREISNLYHTFEPSLYDWEIFKDFGTLPQNVEEVKENKKQVYAQLISKHLNNPVSVEGLSWMSSSRIWAMDPLLPLEGGIDEHFKSAAELTVELLAEKEKESQVQLAGVHTIHHLKNELMNKVSLPLRKYIDNLVEASNHLRTNLDIGELSNIKNHVDELSDKFKKWLNALNFKLNKEEKVFSFPSSEMRTYLQKLARIHNLKESNVNFIVHDLDLQKGPFLSASVPSVLMELVLDEIVGNACAAYKVTQARAKARLETSPLPELGIKIIWERVQSTDGPLIQVQIWNSGTYIPSDKIEILGKMPTKSGTGGSGFGLHFLNIALQIFDCGMVDKTFSRYLLPENIIDDKGNKFVCFSFHFPSK